MRKIEKARRALITSLARIVIGTQTLTSRLVAHVLDRAHIAIAQRAHALAIVAVGAHVASHACIARPAHALARFLVTIVVKCALAITIARFAVRKAVVTLHAAVAIRSEIAELAVARRVALLIGAAGYVAVTFAARGPVRVAVGALLTPLARVLRLALALARERRTIAGRVRVVAVAATTRVYGGDGHVEGSEIAGLALVAVDALCVVLALLAHAAALVVAVYVDAQLVGVNFGIVDARVRVAVALARLALELLTLAVRLPPLLHEAVAARLALIAARVVRAAADELVRHERVRRLALLSVSVAHASAADRYVADTVKVLVIAKIYY